MPHFSCCAKINLGLAVLFKREDGYHELETLMHEIDLSDGLTIETAQDRHDELTIEGMDLSAGPDNLLFKTLALVREAGYEPGFLKMKLRKKIPAGGGLGGGSSDAIGLLGFCARRCGIPLPQQESMAARLGSDTNFFIRGGTSLCYGRGEKIEPLPHPQLYFNLIFPQFFCATPKVFAAMQMDQQQRRPSMCEDWRQGLGFGRNDLESACCRAYPEMGQLLRRYRSAGCEVFLSGSGSTIFTVHREKSCRDQTLEVLKALGQDEVCLPVQSYHR
jgi:4-diphosphocytidyl-2-C-methyl-D-erythritol kinase